MTAREAMPPLGPTWQDRAPGQPLGFWHRLTYDEAVAAIFGGLARAELDAMTADQCRAEASRAWLCCEPCRHAAYRSLAWHKAGQEAAAT